MREAVRATEDSPPNAGGVPAHEGPFDVLVIGASFGGPRAVQAILSALPADVRVPIAVVQHTGPGMTEIWASNLAARCRIHVVQASARERLAPGTAYIAPVGKHMTFMRGTSHTRIRFEHGGAEELHVPSVDRLFTSAARTFGSRTLAVLLTGLGKDGAAGMLSVREAGGYTIAESADTALSHSMPRSALKLGAVVEQLPLQGIVERVAGLVSR